MRSKAVHIGITLSYTVFQVLELKVWYKSLKIGIELSIYNVQELLKKWMRVIARTIQIDQKENLALCW